MSNSDEKMIFNSGEKPPEGTYTCMSCGSDEATLIVPEMAKELPDCPKCGNSLWIKV